MERIERILEHLEKSWGLNLQWKFVGVGRTSCGLSEKHSYHWCEFCRKVKSTGEGLSLCSKNDEILIPRRAERERGSFISTCHAGVSELVVPFFEGDRCTEVFLAGVFLCGSAKIPGVKRIGEVKLRRIRSILEDLSVIFREHRESLSRESARMREVQDARIQTTLDFLGKHFAGKIRIQELAQKACLSESRFLHLFRKETGVSVIACLTEIRLNAARQLLEVSGASIQTVMEQCGFHDQSRFGKLFKAYTGCSPLVYYRKFHRRKDV